jgi:hypothetical protein
LSGIVDRESTQQKGDAGEYAAAAELANRGWMVDMPRRGARNIDLYAHRREGNRTCGVQVKARTRGDFQFDNNFLELAEPTADAWVILVTLSPPGGRSQFFVLPHNHVAAALIAYKGYRDANGKGWPRKMLGPHEFTGYTEAWALMEHPAQKAPWQMLDWVAEALAEHKRYDVFDAILTLRRRRS